MKYKRGFAYLFDMLLIMLLTTMMSNIYFLNPNQISETEYNEYYEIYTNELEKMQDELSSKRSVTIVKNFINNTGEVIDKIYNSSIMTYVWYLLFSILYFGLFQYFAGGKTLGKKLFKLKVTNLDDTKPSLIKMCLRTLFTGCTLFYGMNIFVILGMILSIFLSGYYFVLVYLLMLMLSFILEISYLLVFFIRSDNRSIDDLIFCTKVIDDRL